MRDDVSIMRATLNGGPVGGTTRSSGFAHNMYSSENHSAFMDKPLEGLRAPRTAIHKNMSQLPGFGDPPAGADHFSTMNSIMFQATSVKPAPRHLEVFRRKCQSEETDIFNVRASPKRPELVSAAMAMNRSTEDAERKHQPRYVYGGSYRNSSKIGSDMTEGAAPPDYTTSLQQMEMQVSRGGQGAASTPIHRFNLPQKNTSTFLTTSLTVGPNEPPKVPKSSYGRINNPLPANHTDYHVPSQRRYDQRALQGQSHYTTSHESHFQPHPELELRAPPGKGGHDMTYSKVPLGDLANHYSTGLTHSSTTHDGQQTLDGLRATCPSRGTMGARGGGMMVRPAF